MTIEVVKMKVLDKGNLKAVVSIEINGWLTIHDCRIVQQPGQAAWVSMPQKEYQGHDGQKKYAPLIELGKDSAQKKEIEAAILTAWEVGAVQDVLGGSIQEVRGTPWRR